MQHSCSLEREKKHPHFSSAWVETAVLFAKASLVSRLAGVEQV